MAITARARGGRPRGPDGPVRRRRRGNIDQRQSLRTAKCNGLEVTDGPTSALNGRPRGGSLSLRMLQATMSDDLCRAPRQSARSRAARSCVFSRIGMGSFRSARAARVRVHERCTTAAPKRVTPATKHVTTRRTNRFEPTQLRKWAVATAQRFLSMQRPKPVDTGPPMSGF